MVGSQQYFIVFFVGKGDLIAFLIKVAEVESRGTGLKELRYGGA